MTGACLFVSLNKNTCWSMQCYVDKEFEHEMRCFKIFTELAYCEPIKNKSLLKLLELFKDACEMQILWRSLLQEMNRLFYGYGCLGKIYDPENKQQSFQWNARKSLTPKKVQVCILWLWKYCSLQICSTGQTDNKIFYVNVLGRFQEGVRRKLSNL